MSSETTPAIKQAAEALAEYVGTSTQDMEAEGVPEMAVREAEVRVVLASVLDVEGVAKVIYGSDYEYTTGLDTAWSHETEETKNEYRLNATALRNHLLGGDAQ